MITLVMTIIEKAFIWIAENYHLEMRINEARNDCGAFTEATIKIRQTNKELTKW